MRSGQARRPGSAARGRLRLHVTVGTVKAHINRLLSRLAARDRAQLVIAAYESGLVTPRPR